MVSIKDIAKALSISPSSVSLVLNGKAKEKRISQSLEEKIIAAAKRMGYQPNRAAVSLRTGKSKTIGLIVENISNHFFSTLAHTIQEEARRFHYNVVYCSTENDAEKGKEVMQLLSHQQVDGYIITPSEGMESEVENLLNRKKHVVLVDRCFPDLDVPCVMVDNYNGMKEGLEHLFHSGSQHIGFITVDLNLPQMAEREKAYTDTLQKHKQKPVKKRMLRLPYTSTKEEAVQLISGFLQAQADLDTVVFATNYLGIYGLLSIKQQHLAIPADIKVLCFDDHDIFELHHPPITVIRQPIHEIAKTAINILVAQLDGNELPRQNLHLISPELIKRSSV